MNFPQTLFAFFLATTFLSIAPVGADEFTVTTLTDVSISNQPQAGSLRFGIDNATGARTIRFAPGLNGGEILLQNSEFTINFDITIDASDLPAGITIVAPTDRRIFVVNQKTLALRKLTLSGGGGSDLIDSRGAAIFSFEGILDLNDVTFSGNDSPTAGGAIYQLSGQLFLENSTFSNNSAGEEGGALYLNSTAGTITNCTFTGNNALAGSAIYEGADVSSLRVVTLTHCTVSGNPGSASAIHLHPQGNLTVNNSIVAGNAAGVADIAIESGSGFTSVVTATGNNLIGSNDGMEAVFPTGPLVGTITAPVSPLLGALASNGGSTRTMLPANNSPVRDAGTSSATTLDQRGVTRPKGSAPDLGAVEIDNSARIASLNAQIAAANRAAAKARADLKKAQKAKNAGAIRRANAAIKRAAATVNGLRPQLVGL
jgi:predicted outer membrane repeat protein